MATYISDPDIQTHNEYMIDYLMRAISLCKEPEVKTILEKAVEMATGLEKYLENTCPEETALQKRLLADTRAEPWVENHAKGLSLYPYRVFMINARQSTQFMKTVAEVAKAERILEIGMFTGYSTAIFCDTKCVKSVTCLELDPFLANFVNSRFAGTEEGKKLRILTGPALESLQKLKNAGETFDLVFVDADKGNYINYYKFIMDNDLIGSNGIILMDNTLWRGELYPKPTSEYGQFMYDLNDYVNKDPRVTQVMLQIRDGISFIRRK